MTLSRSDLVGAATSVAERVGGAHRVAVLATPTAATVLAVTGCLIAGVPSSPVPADVRVAEHAHILTDSGAQVWLGEQPEDPAGLPHVPVRLHARSWHRYPGTGAAEHGDGDLHLRHHRTAEGCGDQPGRGGRGPRRRRGRRLVVGDTLVHGLPLFHVHGLVLGLLGSLRVGNRFVHTGHPTPQAYAEAAGTLYFGVPTVWSRIVAEPDAARAVASARLVSGSAALPVPVFDALHGLTGHARWSATAAPRR